LIKKLKNKKNIKKREKKNHGLIGFERFGFKNIKFKFCVDLMVEIIFKDYIYVYKALGMLSKIK
jgi:hypothetical protein